MATEITPKLDTIKVYDSYFFEGGGYLVGKLLYGLTFYLTYTKKLF